MPPIAKFSRELIIEQAVFLIVSQGINKLTARSLAESLHTSARPIFTAFKNMDEVKQCCFDYAYKTYHEQFYNLEGNITFKQIGLCYINFAMTQPQLFQLLFMKFQSKEIEFSEFMKKLDDHFQGTIDTISYETGLGEENSLILYKNMWIYCHGIATLCATNQCKFSQNELNDMLSFVSESVTMNLRGTK